MRTLAALLCLGIIAYGVESLGICPGGLGLVHCLADPCSVNQQCHGYPQAECKPNYCGGCNAVWYDTSGNEVFCH